MAMGVTGIKNTAAQQEAFKALNKGKIVVKYASPRENDGKVGSESNTVRYPASSPISPDTDYVSIDFFNYIKPFSDKAMEQSKGTGGLYQNYGGFSEEALTKERAEGYKSILLFMPEDIQAQYGANWGGVGVGVGQANAASFIGGKAGSISEAIGNTFETTTGGLKLLGYDLAKQAINKGLGGSLTTNQLMGGVSGTIVNPNVELMYEAPELRGFNLNFKMMPRSETEAKNIFTICQTLKKAMLPSFGGTVADKFTSGALLTIPKIVSAKFMTGNKLNKYVTQFKPCAITNVNINYTPDGSYATYEDGSPVATLLSIQFKELKLIFENEILLSDEPIASY
tara:strand:- start:4259 stop:5278 length:1020 start_codon:yes stop_codon:yes gene_type:complete